MKLSHHAGCGKFAEQPQSTSLRLFVFVAKRNVARQIQRNQPELRPIPVRIDRGNMLMLL